MAVWNGVHDRKRSGRPGVSEESAETIRASFVRSPTKSTRRASRELLLPRSTIHKVLHNTQFFKTPSGLCGHTVLLFHLRLLGFLSVSSYDSQGLRWKNSYSLSHGERPEGLGKFKHLIGSRTATFRLVT
jgi:hypothetical protein